MNDAVRKTGDAMTTTATAAAIPERRGLANALWRRQLYKYPDTLPRLGYLAIVVLTTIMLYYLYYVEGAVTPLMLPYYHMSFQFFLYLLVVSNAIGAFSAFIGGLSDKIGRANLTIYGTLLVALIQLFAIPHIHDKYGFAASYCVIGFVEGVILVSTPALMRDFSPQMGRGVAMGFWALGPTMGALCASLVATHTLDHLEPWQDQFIISGIVCMCVVVISFLFLRELSPQLRDQLMVTERERALVEARAKGIDVEAATAHPIRSMLRLDLIASSIAISVFLLFYYASVSVLTIYWVVTFNRTTPQANGINVWLAGFLSLGSGHRRRAVGLGEGAQAVHALRGCLRDGDDGLPHQADRPSPHRVLLQRLGDRAPRRLHRPGLCAVDGELHRAGRGPQPGTDGYRPGHLGLDPANHRRPLFPRAALRDHHLDGARRQPERGRHAADDPGRTALRTEHVHFEVQHDTGPGLGHRQPAHDALRQRPELDTLATILQDCNSTHNLIKALTAAGGLTNPHVLGLNAFNPLALDIQNGKPVSAGQDRWGGQVFAEPRQPLAGGAEAGAGTEDVAGGVEALVDGLSRRHVRLRRPRLLHARPLEPARGPARPRQRTTQWSPKSWPSSRRRSRHPSPAARWQDRTMRELEHWVGGKSVRGSSERTGPVYDPARGVQTGIVPLASASEVDAVVVAAGEAAADWAAGSLSSRAAVLFRFSDLVATAAPDLAAAVTAEHGKVLSDAAGEVARGLDNIEFACGIPHLLKGSHSTEVSGGVDVHTILEPLGVVAGITPFNFPVMVPLWMMANAIACGNAFVLKPSEKDPSPSLVLAELAKEAGVPDGVLNVVHGDAVAVDALLEHPGVAAVSFVGSTPIARHVYENGGPPRQAGPGPRRGEEPHGGPPRRRRRRGSGRRRLRRLRVSG